MQIESLQISNVLSFPYCEDISLAEALHFDAGLNIIIGENGSGKSTALEVINFLFKRVLYRQYSVNQDLFGRRTTITLNERRQTIVPANTTSYSGFRLDPNWDSEDQPQRIRIKIKLDEIDVENIARLQTYLDTIFERTSQFTSRDRFTVQTHGQNYTLDVLLSRNTGNFSIEFVDCQHDFGYEYLSEYHFYKEAISLHNILHAETPLEGLFESFTLISSYRNYHAFQPSISLRDEHPTQQIRNVRSQDYTRSLNTSDTNEPPVFSLVRLRVAEKHFGMITERMNQQECEEKANDLPFIRSINERLKIVNLECKISLLDLRTWQYSFNFFDTRRRRKIGDVNSLSAGQKAIIHLVFEAYGRGDLKGGVVIIDEPEIHLHYQFQHEYLKVIRDLNAEQKCQYILVTHSEALITSETIKSVRRFSISGNGSTKIYAPVLREDQKTLIKILDNTRSTYAFFAKKVVLVEGDTDRYFFRAALDVIAPGKDQEIAFLFVGGKNNHRTWKNLFEMFGLQVFVISDFDYIVNLHYPAEIATSLRDQVSIQEFKDRHTDWQQSIETEYANKVFILKNGDLEHYLGIGKSLQGVIDFCNASLRRFLADDANSSSVEVREHLARILA